mgnify:CR=1 FL=1
MSTGPTSKFSVLREYLTDVQSEYRKITWPPQKEAVAGTIGVVAIVTVVTTVLGFVDFILSRVMQVFLQ